MIHPERYECDKCHKIQDKAEQFWEVGIKANHLNYTNNDFVDSKFKMQVCRLCLESFGIHVSQRPANAPSAPAPPTLEELIRDLARQEMGIQ